MCSQSIDICAIFIWMIRADLGSGVSHLVSFIWVSGYIFVEIQEIHIYYFLLVDHRLFDIWKLNVNLRVWSKDKMVNLAKEFSTKNSGLFDLDKFVFVSLQISIN